MFFSKKVVSVLLASVLVVACFNASNAMGGKKITVDLSDKQLNEFYKNEKKFCEFIESEDVKSQFLTEEQIKNMSSEQVFNYYDNLKQGQRVIQYSLAPSSFKFVDYVNQTKSVDYIKNFWGRDVVLYPFHCKKSKKSKK